MEKLPFHPLAAMFPLIEIAEEVRSQRESIRENGVIDPIDMLDGQVLDGRNRYLRLVELCEEGAELGAGWGTLAGQTLRPDDLRPRGAETRWFRQFLPDIQGDPADYVWAKNFERRHLSAGQRASAAARRAQLTPGRPKAEASENPPIGGITTEKAAAEAHVSPRQVERARVVHEQGVPDLQTALDKGAIAVSAAEQIARMPQEQQHDELQRRGLEAPSAHMASRLPTPPDDLDYFPTPPFATRALLRHVLPILDIWPDDLQTVWEPACGEGHISSVLQESFRQVFASDVFDYGTAERRVPGWTQVVDYTADPVLRPFKGKPDWIITNPPFHDGKIIRFIELSLARAEVGVALFVQTRMLEGLAMYERVYAKTPPTLIAQFVERVPLHKGRYEPDGTTTTAYMWLVWLVGEHERLPHFWIPPGCRKELAMPGDNERFTAHPVYGAKNGLPAAAEDPVVDEPYDPETGELQGDEDGRRERDQHEPGDGERGEDHGEGLGEDRGGTGSDPVDRCKSADSERSRMPRRSGDVDEKAPEALSDSLPAPAERDLHAGITSDPGAPGGGQEGAPTSSDDELVIPAFLDRRGKPNGAGDKT